MSHNEGPHAPLPLSTLHAFPENYFIENIAVTRAGSLLLTVHNRNELIYLDPHATPLQPTVLHKFAEGVCGIVEVEEDIFYVSSGTIGTPGSWGIFRVDVSGYDGKGDAPGVEKLVGVPDALFLNGSTLLSKDAGLILAADSLVKTIFCVDVKKGEVKAWLNDPVLGKVTAEPMIPGINGLAIYKEHLYVSNTDAQKLLRVAIDPTSHEATGAIETVQEHLNVDDFVFDDAGNAYLTTHIFQSVVRLGADGKRERIAGGAEDPVVAGTTACAWGRTDKDRGVLYVTTTGGMSYPVNGKIGPGRVLRIEVGGT